LPKATGILQVYQLDKAELKLNFEMNTTKGLKCCSFGASNRNELACGDFDVIKLFLDYFIIIFKGKIRDNGS
jgi:hypothetical protein